MPLPPVRPARGSDDDVQETQYEQKLLNILKDQGTSYIVWQEIFDNGAKILPDTVIDVWKGGNWQEEMVKVRASHLRTLVRSSTYLVVAAGLGARLC